MEAVEPPQNPAGVFEAKTNFTGKERDEAISEIALLPAQVRAAVAGLDDARLDAKYRNWTIRQIVHHLADSHVNAHARFRLAMTEERPTIKPYDEGRWAVLDDALRAPVEPSIAILDGLHARWVRLLRSLTAEQFRRVYFHPEMGREVSLEEAISSYAWHGRHHTAQITWLRERHDW